MSAVGGKARLVRICAILLLLFSAASSAHDSGMLGIRLQTDGQLVKQLAVDIAVDDLQLAVGLDSDSDESVTWGEYQGARRAIFSYISQGLVISVGGQRCQLIPLPEEGGVQRAGRVSIVSEFAVNCPRADNLLLTNRLLTELDSSPATVLTVVGPGAERSSVIGPDITAIDLSSTGTSAASLSFLYQGIHHILIGVDHLAFLLLLVLPVARHGSLRSRLKSMAGIVTAFTLAHSITLSMSATGLLSLPGKPVEILIAASVVLVGIVNLVKPRQRMGWLIAYGFGLVHGFGFAGALAELDMAENLRLINLAAFNIGVELGQLAVVMVATLVLSLLGNQQQYNRYVVPAVSALASGFGCLWIAQRSGVF